MQLGRLPGSEGGRGMAAKGKISGESSKVGKEGESQLGKEEVGELYTDTGTG